MDLEGKIIDLLNDSIVALGYDIVRVRYFDHSKTLQIMIETKSGDNISVDDCTKVSEAVSPLLDVSSLIDNRYHLEVSSTGLERPLTKHQDYVRFKNHHIRVALNQPVEGTKKIKGYLDQVTSGSITMRVEGDRSMIIDIANIVSANLTLDNYDLFK